MMLSDSVLLVSPDTSLFHGLGVLKSPPGYPAKPFPELPELLELVEPLELLELPIPEELEPLVSPPIPPDDEVPIPPAPVKLRSSLGPHPDATAKSHARHVVEVVTAQIASFVCAMSSCTRNAGNSEASFSSDSGRDVTARDR